VEGLLPDGLSRNAFPGIDEDFAYITWYDSETPRVDDMLVSAGCKYLKVARVRDPTSLSRTQLIDWDSVVPFKDVVRRAYLVPDFGITNPTNYHRSIFKTQ
jgi:hypothetical protein